MSDPNQAGPNQPVSPAPSPVSSNYTPMPAAPHKGNGVLFAVVAFLVVLGGVGVAAVLYLPKLLHKPAAVATEPASPPATQPASTPATPTPDPSASSAQTAPAADANANVPTPTPDSAAPAPAATAEAAPAATPAATKSRAGGKVGKGSASDYGSNPQEAAQRAADQAALDQLEHERSLLVSRSASVDASLTSLKNAQAQQGLGLRGDIAAAQERLHGNMSRLEAAIQNHDLKAARQYMALCDRDADTLDQFLGR